MDSLEAARRIEDHLRVHHMKEQPRCEKITEALTLAVKVLNQYNGAGGVVARFMGMPIECHHVSPDETIILRFETMEHDLTTVRRAFEEIQNTFPHNKVMALPRSIGIEYAGLTELTAIKTHIDNILEEARWHNV